MQNSERDDKQEKGAHCTRAFIHLLTEHLLPVSASRGPVFFLRYPLNGRIDQNETQAKGVSACDLIFRDILS